MVFTTGAGVSARQEAKRARRRASAFRRYRVPFAVLSLGIAVSWYLGYLTQWQAIVVGLGIAFGYARTVGQLKKTEIREAKERANRFKVGAEVERKMGRHLWTLTIGGRYSVLHDRLIFKNSRANVDHIVIGPNGVSVPDSKRRSGKAVWSVLGSDLLYRNAPIRPETEVTAAEAAEIKKALRTLERKYGFEIPVRAAWGVWPHMRLEHGGKVTGKIVGSVTILPLSTVRGWCQQGPTVLSRKQVQEVTEHLKKRFPSAT